MAKLTVEDLPLEGKKVLMRVDFNVPIKDGVVGDDNRIVAALPTIKYVIDHGGRAILFSHLGRIKKEEDKPGLSLRPVAERLSNLLNKPVTFVPVTEGNKDYLTFTAGESEYYVLTKDCYETLINNS